MTTTRLAWLTVALLMPVVMLNYLDRQMLATMKSSVMADVPSVSGDERWGLILATFKWTYAVFSLAAGLIADRVNRRWLIAGSLFAWSAVTVWTGQVRSYEELLLARAMMGLSEAFYFPAALALIADFHSEATRSKAVGLHQLALYVGMMVGAFGGYAADSPAIGWRGAFAASGIIGMIYSVPLILLLRDRRTVAAVSPAGSSVIELITNPSFVRLVICFTLPGMAGWVVRDWMPSILKEQFQIGQGKAGVTANLYWQTAAIAGAILAGWLADQWSRSNPRGRTFVSAIGISLIATAVLGVGIAGSLPLAVGCLIVFGFGWGFFDCNNMPILSQIAPAGRKATGYGLMNFVSLSCGGVADWLFGVLNQNGVPLAVSLGLFAGLAGLAILLMLQIRPRHIG